MLSSSMIMCVPRGRQLTNPMSGNCKCRYLVTNGIFLIGSDRDVIMHIKGTQNSESELIYSPLTSTHFYPHPPLFLSLSHIRLLLLPPVNHQSSQFSYNPPIHPIIQSWQHKHQATAKPMAKPSLESSEPMKTIATLLARTPSTPPVMASQCLTRMRPNVLVSVVHSSFKIST